MATQGINSDLFSRPVRLAADLSGQNEAALEHLFAGAKILVRLEEAFACVPDARETFLFAVNQALRICPNVAVSVPARARDLIEAGDELAACVHGPGHRVRFADIGG